MVFPDIVDPSAGNVQDRGSCDGADLPRFFNQIDNPIAIRRLLTKLCAGEKPDFGAILLGGESCIDANSVWPIDHIFAVSRDRAQAGLVTQVAGERKRLNGARLQPAIIERGIGRSQKLEQCKSKIEVPTANIVRPVDRETHRKGLATFGLETDEFFSSGHRIL